jgi:hypothetical protein
MCPDLGFDSPHIFFQHTHAAAKIASKFLNYFAAQGKRDRDR